MVALRCNHSDKCRSGAAVLTAAGHFRTRAYRMVHGSPVNRRSAAPTAAMETALRDAARARGVVSTRSLLQGFPAVASTLWEQWVKHTHGLGFTASAQGVSRSAPWPTVHGVPVVPYPCHFWYDSLYFFNFPRQTGTDFTNVNVHLPHPSICPSVLSNLAAVCPALC